MRVHLLPVDCNPLSNGAFAAYHDQGKGYRNPSLGTLQSILAIRAEHFYLRLPEGTATVTVAPGWTVVHDGHIAVVSDVRP
jgi:hypothetical protein